MRRRVLSALALECVAVLRAHTTHPEYEEARRECMRFLAKAHDIWGDDAERVVREVLGRKPTTPENYT